MRFSDLTIQKNAPSKTPGRAPKGRQFTVTLLAWVSADRLWELGGGKAHRPVWIAYAAPDQACRAFTANFRAGRKAKSDDGERFEIPRSSPHRWLVERRGEAAVTVAYLPALFDLEPVVHPDAITFVFMPPHWWLDRQAEVLREEFGEDARDAARAALFTAFLDRRSPLPIVQDLRFQLELYRAALEEPWGGTLADRRRQQEELDACGLEPPRYCHTTHDGFEEFLRRQTNAFFAEEIRHGKNRLRPDRRLLPYPPSAPQQLCLHFAMA